MEEYGVTVPATLKIIQASGYVMLDCDKEIFNELKSFCNHLIENNFKDGINYNKKFLENLPPSYHISDSAIIQKIEKFLNIVMPSYWAAWGDDYKKYQKIKITQQAVWALFQKSGEHVSLHNHSKRFSFVIWLQLPYNNDGLDFSSNINEPPGTFMFVLPSFSIQGGIQKHSIPLNKNFEGKMIIWPSHMNHQVTPFHTQDNNYRISVSGNFEFITDSYV